MNLWHRRFCASASWRTRVGADILPWVLDGVDLGPRVLEVGPGYGAVADALCTRAGHLTCVEVDPALARGLTTRTAGQNVTVLCEDATGMSLASATQDAAVCVAMLHHLPSPTLQDRLLAEVARVLRPGGCFVGFDAIGGPLLRLLHLFDTMVAVEPGTFPARLARAGFADIVIDSGAGGFRFRARRAIH